MKTHFSKVTFGSIEFANGELKRHSPSFLTFPVTVVPMLKRFAPLVPLALLGLLFGCAAQSPVSERQVSIPPVTHVQVSAPSAQPNLRSLVSASVLDDEVATENELNQFVGNVPYRLPMLADSILERGKSLIGTRYRFGGTSEAGFDCSGFIGYLFREEAGMTLPRSTSEMINLKAPVVARNKLKPGDLLFFSTRGRGRVSHAGIYLGDDQFIHSSSKRSGGVRVDSLDSAYWSKTFIEAKRALAMAPATMVSSNR
jgi:lipoprotein Spr